MEHQRYTLEWDRPTLPGAATHVSLFEGAKVPLNIVASGHGRGEANALDDLLAALRERHESPEAINYVAEEYRALTGRSPHDRRLATAVTDIPSHRTARRA